MCGSTEEPKFDHSSDWCVACTQAELGVQLILAKPEQQREYI